LLIIVPNPQVSDTTGDAIENKSPKPKKSGDYQSAKWPLTVVINNALFTIPLFCNFN